MSYHLDVRRIPILEYRDLLKRQNLLPSRQILWQDIDLNFDKITARGIENVEQLIKALSTPAKMIAFAREAAIAEDYLTILRREAGALIQKPVPLSDFPDIDAERLEAIGRKGLKNSKDYWESSPEKDDLFCLCDLVRINGVGVAASMAFYAAGYASVTDVAHAVAAEMLRRVTDANHEKHFYKAVLGEKDMQFCIDNAKLLLHYFE